MPNEIDKFNSTQTFTTTITSHVLSGSTATIFIPPPIQFIKPPLMVKEEEPMVKEEELHRTISLKKEKQ